MIVRLCTDSRRCPTSEILELCIEVGLLKQSGSWFTLLLPPDGVDVAPNADDWEEVMKEQGLQKIRSAISQR